MGYKYSRYNIIKEHDDYKVLYNSYTKASIIFEKNYDLSFIEKDSSINTIDEKIRIELINQGFIIDDNRDEFKELKYAYLKKYFDNSTISIALIPTLKCNFKCPYCCEKPFTCGKENIPKYFETLKKFSNKEFSNYEHIHINLFGGEPLLYYKYSEDYLKWLDNYAKSNNITYSIGIVTNGSLIDKEKMDFFIKHNLLLLQITLDSDKTNHDKMRIFKNGKPSFDLLIKKIELVSKLLDNNDFQFVVRINLNNTNVKKVKESLELIKPELRKNINLMFRVVYNTSEYFEKNINKIDKLEEYIKAGKKLGFGMYTESYILQPCEAANDRRGFYLLPNLTLSKCASELGHEACSFGVLNPDGEVELDYINQEKWFEANADTFNNKKCINCKMLPDCLGGCPLYRIKNNKRSCRSFDMVSLPNYYGELDE